MNNRLKEYLKEHKKDGIIEGIVIGGIKWNLNDDEIISIVMEEYPNTSEEYIMDIINNKKEIYYERKKKIERNTTKMTLKAARTNNNYTQNDMAKLLNVSKSTVSRWELGKLKIPDNMLEKYCEICHIKRENISIRGNKNS